jgi:RNA polymerase sigma-70 factor (ECF subfamily)
VSRSLAAPIAVTRPVTSAPVLDLDGLFRTHGRRLYRLARRFSESAEEAEDLVQETFLRAARTQRSLPPDLRNAEAWLVRTLVNLGRDGHRRRRVRSAARALLARPDIAPDNPERSAVAGTDVSTALAALPPRRRAVVVMCELEELETAEVARLLGIAPATVRWHLAAGRNELTRRLGVEPPKEEST